MRFLNAFAVVLSAASALATPLKRDAKSIKGKLALIEAQLNALNASVTAYPDGPARPGLLLVPVVNTTLYSTKISVDEATSDTRAFNGKFSSDDGKAIVQSLERIEHNVTDALKAIVEKKHVLYGVRDEQGKPDPSSEKAVKDILENLKKLGASFSTLADANGDKVSSDFGNTVIKVKNAIAEAFKTTIAELSSPPKDEE
ncbi:hypothetical protein PQX77_017768 [Marasmius sp. AFHP31]|nr:hypothetical protein PQX77_017768 [Marasmius sp. AFHP31]